VRQFSNLITRKLKIMTDLDRIFSKRKAISALFPYAISLERDGNQGMIDEVLRVTAIPYSRKFLWRRMEAVLFAESSSPSLDRAIALVSPYLPWTDSTFYDHNTVDRWAAAALAVEHTEEVGQSVVDVLLQIASDDSLRPRIPDDAWALLKNPVSLPSVSRGRSLGTGLDVVLHVRQLGYIDVLKSYYLLVWSEWDSLSDSVINEMETSIKEDFGGVGVWGHRKDLIERLDTVLVQLDLRSTSLDQEKPEIGENCIERAKEQYQRLRDAFVTVDTEAMETLTSTSPKFNNRFRRVYRFPWTCAGSHPTFYCALPPPYM
jgi:hypothetical protein